MPELPRALLLGSGGVGTAVARSLAGLADVVTGDPERIRVDPGTDVAVLAVQRPRPDIADRLGEACHAASVPWCAVTQLAHVAEIGPMVVPGRTPCHDCWRRRRRSHAEDERLARLVEAAAIGSRGAWFDGELPGVNDQAASLVAYEAMQLVHGRQAIPPGGMGDFRYLDALDGEISRHLFSSVGGCPRCGTR